MRPTPTGLLDRLEHLLRCATGSSRAAGLSASRSRRVQLSLKPFAVAVQFRNRVGPFDNGHAATRSRRFPAGDDVALTGTTRLVRHAIDAGAPLKCFA